MNNRIAFAAISALSITSLLGGASVYLVATDPARHTTALVQSASSEAAIEAPVEAPVMPPTTAAPVTPAPVTAPPTTAAPVVTTVPAAPPVVTKAPKSAPVTPVSPVVTTEAPKAPVVDKDAQIKAWWAADGKKTYTAAATLMLKDCWDVSSCDLQTNAQNDFSAAIVGLRASNYDTYVAMGNEWSKPCRAHNTRMSFALNKGKGASGYFETYEANANAVFAFDTYLKTLGLSRF